MFPMQRVQFLVGKLRSRKPWGMIKKGKKVPCRLAPQFLSHCLYPSISVLILFSQRITNKFLSSPHMCVCAPLLSWVQLFVTPPTVVCQVPLSLKFFREEYWSKLIFPPPGESSQPRDQICTSCDSDIGGQILYHCATWEAPSSYEELRKAFLIVLHSGAWFYPQMASAYIFPSTGSPSLQIRRLI